MSNKKINIVIPASGLGSRFVKAGYAVPKPFIDVMGKPMIKWVIENFENIPDRDVNFIIICNKNHVKDYDLIKEFEIIFAGKKCTYEIIQIDKLTEGSACTCLKARKLIDNEDELLIANSDQFLEYSKEDLFRTINKNNPDGLIITTNSDSCKWSYAKVNNNGYITQVKEKEVISQYATVGIYYFKRGNDFIISADEMIHKELKVNNEYYTCPVYNILINSYGKKILNYPISNINFWGLGTPEDLDYFLRSYNY
jgi:dTDP-glucose pyrophosphorylase